MVKTQRLAEDLHQFPSTNHFSVISSFGYDYRLFTIHKPKVIYSILIWNKRKFTVSWLLYLKPFCRATVKHRHTSPPLICHLQWVAICWPVVSFCTTTSVVCHIHNTCTVLLCFYYFYLQQKAINGTLLFAIRPWL